MVLAQLVFNARSAITEIRRKILDTMQLLTLLSLPVVADALELDSPDRLA